MSGLSDFSILVLMAQRLLLAATRLVINNDSVMVAFIISNTTMNSRSHNVLYPGKPRRVKCVNAL